MDDGSSKLANLSRDLELAGWWTGPWLGKNLEKEHSEHKALLRHLNLTREGLDVQECQENGPQEGERNIWRSKTVQMYNTVHIDVQHTWADKRPDVLDSEQLNVQESIKDDYPIGGSVLQCGGPQKGGMNTCRSKTIKMDNTVHIDVQHTRADDKPRVHDSDGPSGGVGLGGMRMGGAHWSSRRSGEK